MSNQRYERVAANDEDDSAASVPHQQYPIPNSPPPSFRSAASSPLSTSRRLLDNDPLAEDADRTLADTFDTPSDDEDSDDEHGDGLDDRQRLMRGNSAEGRAESQEEQTSSEPGAHPGVIRRVTQLPVFQPTSGRIYGSGMGSDGVFTNLSAKPSPGDDLEEKPPTYEQAAADATPPYWETTILAPGMVSDDVFVDGLPVGGHFSFVWNAMISMSFTYVGFLLTYLLHTTHAAKNGSLAGLGITLIQSGFTIKGASSADMGGGDGDNGDGDFSGAPPDPSSHDFDPNNVASGGGSGQSSGNISSMDWFAYILMILGWFILIKAVSDYVRAKRHEKLVLQSPDRGLGVAVVAEGESPEHAV